MAEKSKSDGFQTVRLPEGMVKKVDEYVEQGIFASRAQACVAFITAGMIGFDAAEIPNQNAMWLNYVIERNEVLINFECDDSLFTSESDSHVNFDKLIKAFEAKLYSKFPTVKHFTLTTVRNQNAMKGFAAVHGNLSEYSTEDIQEFVTGLGNDYEFIQDFYQ